MLRPSGHLGATSNDEIMLIMRYPISVNHILRSSSLASLKAFRVDRRNRRSVLLQSGGIHRCRWRALLVPVMPKRVHARHHRHCTMRFMCKGDVNALSSVAELWTGEPGSDDCGLAKPGSAPPWMTPPPT